METRLPVPSSPATRGAELSLAMWMALARCALRACACICALHEAFVYILMQVSRRLCALVSGRRAETQTECRDLGWDDTRLEFESTFGFPRDSTSRDHDAPIDCALTMDAVPGCAVAVRGGGLSRLGYSLQCRIKFKRMCM